MESASTFFAMKPNASITVGNHAPHVSMATGSRHRDPTGWLDIKTGFPRSCSLKWIRHVDAAVFEAEDIPSRHCQMDKTSNCGNLPIG